MSKTLGEIAFITKLAGFEHTKYIQGNCAHTKLDESYIPLFIGKTVRDGKIDKQFDWYISKSISDELPRSQLNKKCLVLPYVGSLGDLAIFDGSYLAHLGSNVAKIELNEDSGYLEEFIYYFLKSPYGQSLLLRDMQGAVQKNITMEAIRNVTLPDIEFNEQKVLLKILMSLDEKINNNNHINLELEAMAKNIYDYWFLQFDFPNQDGKPYKSYGGKMVWNEELKREIPDGWKVKCLGDFLELLKDGTHNPPKRVEEGVPLLTGTMFGDVFLDYNVATYIDEKDFESIHSQYKPQRDDVIITKIGTLGNVNYLTEEDIPLAIHCNSALLRFPQNYRKMYSLMLTKSSEFQARLRAVKGQSVQEFVSLQKISSIHIIIPEEQIVSRFNKETYATLDMLSKIRKENQELVSLRDFLLPLLMNGQVGFKE